MNLLRPAMLLLIWAAPLSAQDDPATLPAIPPMAASQPATTQSARVSPAAALVLAKLAAAYATKQPMQFAGTLTGDFDVAGRAKHFTLDITGSTDGRGRFWHYGRATGLLASDGTHCYLYDQKRNTYAELDVSDGRAVSDQLDPAISDILLDENPGLLLTLTDDADSLLRRLATEISLSDDGHVVLSLPEKTITLQLDPSNQLIAQSTVDFTPAFNSRHASGVKRAKAVLSYKEPHFSRKSDAYAWSPPATASQFALQNELMHAPVIAGRPATQPSKK